MRFNKILLEVTDGGSESEAKVRLIFDPPLPDNQDEVEITPALILVRQIISLITTSEDDDDGEEDDYDEGIDLEEEEGVREPMEFQFQAPKTIQ